MLIIVIIIFFLQWDTIFGMCSTSLTHSYTPAPTTVKKFGNIKSYPELLLVRSQEAHLPRCTETWEQWRVERLRDFEEKGGGVKRESKNEVRSAVWHCLLWRMLVKILHKFCSDPVSRPITNCRFIFESCKAINDMKTRRHWEFLIILLQSKMGSTHFIKTARKIKNHTQN